MRLWPTILIYAGCAAVATGVVWHLLAPATTAADRESPPVASAPVPPPAIQPSVNQPPSPPSTPPAVDPSSDQKTIEWLFPQFVMAGSAEALFFTVSGSAGYFVMRYRLQGINRTKEFLTSVRARVIPKNSGIPILLQFEIEPGSYADTDRARGVPPGATFTVAGRVLGSHRGDERVASVSEYLERYGGFTFEFECDELPKFTHSFSYSEVSEMLLLAERKNTEAYTPPPRVQLKP